MTDEQGTLFDERFMGRYAGPIMSDPTTALVELVANSWDAYATKVSIDWPERGSGEAFAIHDNGIGMSADDFAIRWRTLEYDRIAAQGDTVHPPPGLPEAQPRKVYGRNGRGRHAAFYFSSPYKVRTWRDKRETTFLVSQGATNPIEILKVDDRIVQEGQHGTEIIGTQPMISSLSADDVRGILSTRFLMDPSFSVSVNGVRVSFSDVPADSLKTIEVDVPGRGTARLLVIDSLKADRTTRQHGVAWWVNKRLVGQGGWRISDDRLLDGRTEEAKRYTFIVHADFLAPAVAADWSDFRPEMTIWRETQAEVTTAIKTVISGITRQRRERAKDLVREQNSQVIAVLSPIDRARWEVFVDTVLEQCPSLTETELNQIAGLLATLEVTSSQYSLISKLHNLSPEDLDQWNDVLQDWTVATASAALDEVAKRLKLIEELRVRTTNRATDEVQDLQPLIGQSLWIFGPQFESIEFTSNQGMTTVIRHLFGDKSPASRNRPDFAISPEGTVGLYARPFFDADANEAGTDTLIIVELKKPGVRLGADEKGQVWKYVKELARLGHVTDRTSVVGYVLGDSLEPEEVGERREGDRTVIRPMLYSTFIGQAEKRMLNLHRKLADAPFMRDVIARLDAVHLADQGRGKQRDLGI